MHCNANMFSIHNSIALEDTTRAFLQQMKVETVASHHWTLATKLHSSITHIHIAGTICLYSVQSFAGALNVLVCTARQKDIKRYDCGPYNSLQMFAACCNQTIKPQTGCGSKWVETCSNFPAFSATSHLAICG
jgi:hypothetical protein